MSQFSELIRPRIGLAGGGQSSMWTWLALTVFVLFLPFAEWRVIVYEFHGHRSLAAADLLFLVVAFKIIMNRVHTEGAARVLNEIKTLWYVFLPLAAMAVVYTSRAALPDMPPSFTRILYFGLTIYLVLSMLIFARLDEGRLIAYLQRYIIVVVLLLFASYGFTRWTSLEAFLYSETPALHFPFSSPNQMALFAMIHLILGVGVILSRQRSALMYLVMPLMILIILQTGSRSITLLSAAGLLAMIGVAAVMAIHGVTRRRMLLHLLGSLFLAGSIAVFSIADLDNMQDPNARAVSVFKNDMQRLLLGKADDYRGRTWSMILKRVQSAARDGKKSRQDDAVVIQGSEGGAHNAYLDLLLNWGHASLAAFLLFLAGLAAVLLRTLWRERRSVHLPLYASILIAFGGALGAIYSNPLLHLKFLWIFFGSILALAAINRRREEEDEGDTDGKITG